MQKISNDDLNRLSTEEFKDAPKTPVILVLDNVRSLMNVGSFFRTADAFRLQAIYLCGITGTPPDREINKTALGATETVEWKHFKTTQDALDALKELNFKVVAIEQVKHAIMLNDLKVEADSKYALIFGSEVGGVDQEIINQCDFSVEIPQLGKKHSLNIAVSAGIVSWEFAKQLSVFNA